MRNIPKRYGDRTFETFQRLPGAAATAYDAAWEAGKDRRSLVLVGRPGVGKTHLAAAIGNREPMGGEWCNVPELINLSRQDIRTGENEGGRWAKELATEPGFVVLDDLGREKVSEWTGELVYVLVNRRYEAMLPTIITSNLTIAELGANGYAPVLSRLSEEGRLVELASASDYRTRRAA